MSERAPRSTAPEPTSIDRSPRPATANGPEQQWENDKQKVGEFIGKYVSKTYVLDGEEYMVRFAKPAGSVEGDMSISQFDLMGEKGDFIEGISSQDLEAKINSADTKNAITQKEQSDNGGHQEDDSENDASKEQHDQPSQAELDKREHYVFYEATWHRNREFTLGGHICKVNGMYYSGNDGNYTTDAVDILDTETGELMQKLTIPELEAKIAAEQQQNLMERINNELKDFFDENAALERAQFEAFLYRHPELLENSPDEEAEPNDEPQTSPVPITQGTTIDAIEDVEPLTNAEIEQKGADAMEEFDKFVAGHPELEELRDEYANDLEAYLDELRIGNHERVG